MQYRNPKGRFVFDFIAWIIKWELKKSQGRERKRIGRRW